MIQFFAGSVTEKLTKNAKSQWKKLVFFTSPLQSSLLEVHVLCDCEEFAKDSKQLVYL